MKATDLPGPIIIQPATNATDSDKPSTSRTCRAQHIGKPRDRQRQTPLGVVVL